MILNAWQKSVARTYSEGDFSHFADKGEMDDDDLAGCGDSLFRFLMTELSDREGCDRVETAIGRITWARNRLDETLAGLEAP